jgi:hypothetical protein
MLLLLPLLLPPLLRLGPQAAVAAPQAAAEGVLRGAAVVALLVVRRMVDSCLLVGVAARLGVPRKGRAQLAVHLCI